MTLGAHFDSNTDAKLEGDYGDGYMQMNMRDDEEFTPSLSPNMHPVHTSTSNAANESAKAEISSRSGEINSKAVIGEHLNKLVYNVIYINLVKKS